MAWVSLNVSVNDRKLQEVLRRTERQVSRRTVDQQARKLANETKKKLVDATPKRFTGETKKGWRVRKLASARYQVVNRRQAFAFIERGTKAHGPVKANYLFIPLTRAAHRAGPRGVIGNKRFKRGIHYIFKKRVRGIKPMKIVEKLRGSADRRTEEIINRAIEKAIK